MNLFKRNLVANVAGLGWSALMGLLCIPLYIKFMGIEAFGLVGFYIMLQAALQLLDFGLSPTMNRELARYSAQPEKAGEARDFVRTLELGYWLLGIIIGTAVIAAAPLIATHWIKAGAIPVDDIRHSVMMMGVLAALQWPLSFYQGGLFGLQRHVLLSGLTITMSTFGYGGAILILLLVSPTITAYFSWQIAVSAVHVTAITVFLWRCLPAVDRSAHFDPALFRNIRRFATGMSVITLLALILTQMDKVILAKLLSLKMFGYYTLAGAVGNGLYVLITPMFNSIFPRFSALAFRGEEGELKELYHQGTQLMAVLVLPVAAVIALFSFDILLLWTGSVEISSNTSPIVSVLVIGTALNGLTNLPYALQIAHGWTKIGIYINILLIFLLVPSIIVMTGYYGAVGAASVWVALNAVYIAIGVPLTHLRLLRGEALRWFLKDVGPPLAAAVLVTGLGRIMIASPMSPGMTVSALAMLLVCSIAMSALAASRIRSIIAAEIIARI